MASCSAATNQTETIPNVCAEMQPYILIFLFESQDFCNRQLKTQLQRNVKASARKSRTLLYPSLSTHLLPYKSQPGLSQIVARGECAQLRKGCSQQCCQVCACPCPQPQSPDPFGRQDPIPIPLGGARLSPPSPLACGAGKQQPSRPAPNPPLGLSVLTAEETRASSAPGLAR